MAKTSAFNAGAVGSIPGRGAKIPYALWPKKHKTSNENNIVINSIKTFKMVQVKNKAKGKKDDPLGH